MKTSLKNRLRIGRRRCRIVTFLMMMTRKVTMATMDDGVNENNKDHDSHTSLTPVLATVTAKRRK